MLITTTNQIEGKVIREYKGIVFGEVISGINMFKDIGAGLRNILGGRSAGYEDELMACRQNALEEMQKRAKALGANTIIGIDIDYEMLGSGNGMMMVTTSGTAVIVE
ncbi:putative heavy metal-binding protein [Thomasclavelia spiroformis]|uniref:putative heavy metal-binding protein n=1 Tax=Thomasclavelia spiroformis TaxID=29348 RepID=UPI003996B846